MLMAAATFPPSRRMGAPTQRAPKVASSSSNAYPRSLIFSNSFRNRDTRVIVCGVKRSNLEGRQHMVLFRRGQESRERFAHRGTVKRTPGARVCDHAKRVRALHYIQIKNVLPVQDSQVYRFTRYLPQIVQQWDGLFCEVWSDRKFPSPAERVSDRPCMRRNSSRYK